VKEWQHNIIQAHTTTKIRGKHSMLGVWIGLADMERPRWLQPQL